MRQAILIAAIILPLAGCAWLERNVDENRTPEEMARVEQIDMELDALEAERAELISAVEDAGKKLVLAKVDAAEARAALASAVTPADAEAASVALAEIAVRAMEDAKTIEAALERMTEIKVDHSTGVDERAELDSAALKRVPAFAGIGLLGPLLPAPLNGAAGFLEILLGGLGARVATKRGREHLKNGGKHLLAGAFGNAIGDVLKLTGFSHSNTDTLNVLKGARSVAFEEVMRNREDGGELAIIDNALTTMADYRAGRGGTVGAPV